jgi:hypothetical protein
MSTAEAIFERAKALPGELQVEALHYLDYLLLRQQAEMEDRAWARDSAAQLLVQYAPADAIYDGE